MWVAKRVTAQISGPNIMIAEAGMLCRFVTDCSGARHVVLGEIHPARIELATFSV